jgi:hypothetical protein
VAAPLVIDRSQGFLRIFFTATLKLGFFHDPLHFVKVKAGEKVPKLHLILPAGLFL